MSKDNSKLVKEMDVLKEKLDKLEVQNAELKQQNIGLKEQNKEMKEQIVELANQNKKLVEEIGVMNAEKFEQDNPTQSSVSCPSSSQKIHGEKSTDLEENTEIYVRNWLTETLAWICRKQMANSALSTLCKTFKRLCWPKLHGNVKPHEVDSLHIRDEFDEESGNYQSKLLRTHRLLSGWDWDENEIPLASVQPPDYIIGFKGISIYFLNGQVMQFIECILPKINAFTLDFRPMIPIWHTADQITQIHGLYEMLAMKATSICDENFFDFLRIKPNAFGLIENPQTISAKLTIIEHINLLLQWLIRPLNDHKPKFFSIQIKEQLMAKFLDKIKETRLDDLYKYAKWFNSLGSSINKLLRYGHKQFLGSTQSANFLISLEWWGTGYPNFTMENEQTGEVLALYSLAAFGGWNDDNYFLVRHQKGKEHLRADWEKQMEQLFRLPRVHVQITNTGEF